MSQLAIHQLSDNELKRQRSLESSLTCLLVRNHPITSRHQGLSMSSSLKNRNSISIGSPGNRSKKGRSVQMVVNSRSEKWSRRSISFIRYMVKLKIKQQQRNICRLFSILLSSVIHPIPAIQQGRQLQEVLACRHCPEIQPRLLVPDHHAHLCLPRYLPVPGYPAYLVYPTNLIYT